MEAIKPGDSVLLLADFATYPNMPCGETDGPTGLASLARVIRFGLGGVPVVVAGERAMEANRQTVKAAGMNIFEYNLAKITTSGAAAAEVFPTSSKSDSKAFAVNMIEKYQPKAVISVETVGPNRKGIKHFAPGTNAEEKDTLPSLEFLFHEANKRRILTIGCIDGGNELGSGTIEEDIRKIVPYGGLCDCPCQDGIACAVKADIVFPANMSNWAAYGISAMVAYLVKKPDILQDALTERRMLDACIMAGAAEGDTGGLFMSVDQVGYEGQEALVTLLHTIIRNGLLGLKVDRFSSG